MSMLSTKSILCLVPLPPPITGAALASEIVVDYLRQRHNVITFGYQRGDLISGKFSIKQFFRILNVGLKVIRLRVTNTPISNVYYVISSSRWGNLRDLFLLVSLGGALRKKAVLHLHGANLNQMLAVLPKWQKLLNKILLGDVKAAIVLGNSFQHMFDGYLPQGKVKVVVNFFEPKLLIDRDDLALKYHAPDLVNLLFLSNLIFEKGYSFLLDAFLRLPAALRNRARLDFVGNINSENEKHIFLEKIAAHKNISYHGPLTGEKKIEMFKRAHIFCLPTFFKYEGQPISIIEAYAAGCVVVTTLNGGIGDIFVDQRNGFEVEFHSSGESEFSLDIDSLEAVLRQIIDNIESYRHIAEHNRSEAVTRYQLSRFAEEVMRIVFDNE